MIKHITVTTAAFLAAASVFAQSAENQAITDSKPLPWSQMLKDDVTNNPRSIK